MHFNSQCIYITYKPRDVCATVHGIAIKHTFTTCLHTPFTEVPERGAICQPFARGRNNHTATPGVTIMMISVVKSRLSAGLSTQLGDTHTHKNGQIKGLFHPMCSRFSCNQGPGDFVCM